MLQHVSIFDTVLSGNVPLCRKHTVQSGIARLLLFRFSQKLSTTGWLQTFAIVHRHMWHADLTLCTCRVCRCATIFALRAGIVRMHVVALDHVVIPPQVNPRIVAATVGCCVL